MGSYNSTVAVIKTDDIKIIEKLKLLNKEAIENKSNIIYLEMIKELFEIIGIDNINYEKQFPNLKNGNLEIAVSSIEFIADDTVFIEVMHGGNFDGILYFLSKAISVKFWAFSSFEGSGDKLYSFYGYFDGKFEILSFECQYKPNIPSLTSEYFNELDEKWRNSMPNNISSYFESVEWDYVVTNFTLYQI